MDKWSCMITEQPGKITVGENFSVSCQGSEPVSFKDPQIVIPEQKESHRLHILKSLQRDLKSIELQVVSYRTGAFENTPFIITDGENSVLGEGLSFSVESVLPEKPVKPHPAFGPWKTPYPFWWISLSGIAFFLFLTGLMIFGRVFFKRRSFIKKIQSRCGPSLPSKRFINALRRMDLESPGYVKDLSRFFRIFLEDLLFIPTLEQPPSTVLKFLKKYNKAVYKSHGRRMENLLNEMDKLKSKKTTESFCQELKKNCFQLAFDLEEGRRS